MANQKQQKLKMLKILELLQNESDPQHPLKCEQIIARLNALGINAERKSIYSDLQILTEAGWDIRNRRDLGYWLENRRYSLGQIKIMMDTVDSMSMLSTQQAKELKHSLLQECSLYQRPLLRVSDHSVENKQNGTDILHNIEMIMQALRNNVEIEFRYFDFTVKKQKRYRKQSQFYQLFPYALILYNERYYCICYSFRHKGFSHYRLDKMDQIRLKDEILPRVPFDPQEYASRSFGMYSLKPTNITLRFDLKLANTVFDRFGMDILISRITPEDFDVNLTLTLSPPFLGWLFQFKDQVRIIQPESLKQQMRDYALSVLEQLEEQ